VRNRVALTATLSTLLALVLLVALSGLAIVEERDEKLSGDVELALKLVTGTAPSGKDAEGFSALTQYLRKNGLRLGVYTREGGAIYASDGVAAPLDQLDVAQARVGGSGVYKRTGPDGESILCAIGVLKDGAFARVSVLREGFWQAVGARKSAIYAALFLAVSLFFFGFLALLNARRSRAIERIMDVLDSYSDGRYNVRLSVSDGFGKETVGEYNAILSRIDERIFNQRSRNHALSVVMNQMQNGIIAVDDKLRVILVTPAAKQLLGITGSAHGMHINDASQDVRLDQVLSDAMGQIGVYTNEVAARTAVGRGHRPLRLYVSPMRKDGKVVGALAMVEDITQLRRLEQVRTDFAANVSHELKTPLTSIRGFVETLLDGALEKPEMARKFLNIIMLETERLTRLINDILSISKLESGMDEAPKERIRLDKAAYDVVEMLSIHAKEKEIRLACHMNKDPVYIIGNKDQVEQMLINLVENGIKYNLPGGSVTVQVFKSATEANLTVADTGIGIAEENLPRMFERFYRVDKGRSRSMGGTGLGLAIVKHIVRTMRGEIEVHSKLGEGTEFLVSLPLAPQTAGSDSGDDLNLEED
jgi:two-component system phosphate regulon sensor histidine kinase PhoR